jgi:hypothetical protein
MGRSVPISDSRAAIVEAAAEIDQDELTIPGLAARLGVSRSTVCN